MLFRHLVQLAVADTELDDLLADRFDLEIIQAPIIDADVLVAKSEAVKLGFGFAMARRGRFGIGKIRMRIQHVQLLELLDPSQDAVKWSAQKYSQLHVTCITNIIIGLTFQNSTIPSAGFPLI